MSNVFMLVNLYRQRYIWKNLIFFNDFDFDLVYNIFFFIIVLNLHAVDRKQFILIQLWGRMINDKI